MEPASGAESGGLGEASLSKPRHRIRSIVTLAFRAFGVGVGAVVRAIVAGGVGGWLFSAVHRNLVIARFNKLL